MPISGDQYTFSSENVSKAPDQSGVYALYQSNSTTYIGRAQESIRARLQRHKSGHDGSCTQAADTYRREVTSNPVARERELLEEYKKTYGRLPRCNDVVP
jgi:predicted GIY-YIG superfamily endonuclease